MADYNALFEANKDGWNKRTGIHKDSEFYDLEGFKKNRNSLNNIELEELGDVKGKSLLHLQCHFGQDSLSWAALGADVTGLDFSEEAIATAKNLSLEMKLDASFVCANVYDTCAVVMGQFDIVFTSYGTIGWLPRLKPWAEIIAAKLKPGGFFYIADFHPVLWMLDDDMKQLKYSYFNDEVIVTQQKGTYTDREAPIEYTEYGWNHPLSDILNSLIGAGLQIEFLHEFPFSPYNCFANVEQHEDGMWRFKDKGNRFPMMYTIKAYRK